MPVGGVVLAGGRSSRMGRPKAALDWHGSTLLHRATALLGRTVDGPVVVVAAAGQSLPPLPSGVRVVTDPVEGLGPLAGIGTGLGALIGSASAAFVCSTDLPFLHPAFVRRVLRALEPDVDVALPHAGGFRQPLAAAYRTGLAPLIAALVADGQLRPGMLYDRVTVAQLDDADLLADPDVARLDPDLDSVLNINTADEYAAARAREPAAVTVRRGGTVTMVRAATLGALGRSGALARSGALGGSGAATLNGQPVPADPDLPLVCGDTVAVG